MHIILLLPLLQWYIFLSIVILSIRTYTWSSSPQDKLHIFFKYMVITLQISPNRSKLQLTLRFLYGLSWRLHKIQVNSVLYIRLQRSYINRNARFKRSTHSIQEILALASLFPNLLTSSQLNLLLLFERWSQMPTTQLCVSPQLD